MNSFRRLLKVAQYDSTLHPLNSSGISGEAQDWLSDRRSDGWGDEDIAYFLLTSFIDVNEEAAARLSSDNHQEVIESLATLFADLNHMEGFFEANGDDYPGMGKQYNARVKEYEKRTERLLRSHRKTASWTGRAWWVRGDKWIEVPSGEEHYEHTPEGWQSGDEWVRVRVEGNELYVNGAYISTSLVRDIFENLWSQGVVGEDASITAEKGLDFLGHFQYVDGKIRKTAKVRLKRIAPGYYETADGKWVVSSYYVSAEEAAGYGGGTRWIVHPIGGVADDVYDTKREAVEALEWLIAQEKTASVIEWSDKPKLHLGNEVSWGGWYHMKERRYLNIKGGEFETGTHFGIGQRYELGDWIPNDVTNSYDQNHDWVRVRVYFQAQEIILYENANLSDSLIKRMCGDIWDADSGRVTLNFTVRVDGRGGRSRRSLGEWFGMTPEWEYGSPVFRTAAELSDSLDKRLGYCFELSVRYVWHVEGDTDKSDVRLVHGSIQGGGHPRIVHGWVEFVDERLRKQVDRMFQGKASDEKVRQEATVAHDPVAGQTLPLSAFYAMFNAIPEFHYSIDEMNRHLNSSGNFGPWENIKYPYNKLVANKISSIDKMLTDDIERDLFSSQYSGIMFLDSSTIHLVKHDPGPLANKTTLCNRNAKMSIIAPAFNADCKDCLRAYEKER